MSLKDFMLGRPLATEEGKGEKVGPGKGIGVFGLDALGSAVYGPEAALTMLIPLGLAGIGYIVPVTILIAVLAGVVFFSYSQTIKAYPGGGGTYTVATENLGTNTGLVAGAALMIDYVLVVAVGISAGVGTLVSVFPALQSQTTKICLIILFIITMVNLRGVRESGAVFLIPAYLFIVSMIIVLGVGIVKTLTAGGNPQPVEAPPQLQEAGKAMTF